MKLVYSIRIDMNDNKRSRRLLTAPRETAATTSHRDHDVMRDAAPAVGYVGASSLLPPAGAHLWKINNDDMGTTGI